MAGGELFDPHFAALGVDHRELGATAQRGHEQVIKQMTEDAGLAKGQRLRGLYGLSRRQQQAMLDFLHPAAPLKGNVAKARTLVSRGIHAVAARMA